VTARTWIQRATLLLAVVAALALAGCGADSDDEQPASTTPEAAAQDSGSSDQNSGGRTTCRPGAEPTPQQTEGPYYKAGAPRRTSLLEQGVAGRRLSLRGRVLTTDCRPLAGARVDFWQADGNGAYDNDGYGLRGYQLTDERGRYRLETVVPGRYEPRTPHIHVKLTPRGGSTVTTQLYLPGESRNESDPIYEPEAVISLSGRGSGAQTGKFDFIVRQD
jgi:protocatechuate 3,4-dioxygenase beta subunit